MWSLHVIPRVPSVSGDRHVPRACELTETTWREHLHITVLTLTLINILRYPLICLFLDDGGTGYVPSPRYVLRGGWVYAVSSPSLAVRNYR